MCASVSHEIYPLLWRRLAAKWNSKTEKKKENNTQNTEHGHQEVVLVARYWFGGDGNVWTCLFLVFSELFFANWFASDIDFEFVYRIASVFNEMIWEWICACSMSSVCIGKWCGFIYLIHLRRIFHVLVDVVITNRWSSKTNRSLVWIYRRSYRQRLWLINYPYDGISRNFANQQAGSLISSYPCPPSVL